MRRRITVATAVPLAWRTSSHWMWYLYFEYIISHARRCLMYPKYEHPTAVSISQVFDGAIRCVLERNQRKIKKKKGKKNCVIS